MMNKIYNITGKCILTTSLLFSTLCLADNPNHQQVHYIPKQMIHAGLRDQTITIINATGCLVNEDSHDTSYTKPTAIYIFNNDASYNPHYSGFSIMPGQQKTITMTSCGKSIQPASPCVIIGTDSADAPIHLSRFVYTSFNNPNERRNTGASDSNLTVVKAVFPKYTDSVAYPIVDSIDSGKLNGAPLKLTDCYASVPLPPKALLIK